MGHTTSTGYSADVQIRLLIGTTEVPVSHSANDYVITAAALDLPPGPAKLCIRVDDTRVERAIYLPEGIRASTSRTPIRHADTPTPS